MAVDVKHPLDQLDPDEVRAVAAAVRAAFGATSVRFVAITLHEPSRAELAAYANGAPPPARVSEVILITPDTGLAHEVRVELEPARAPHLRPAPSQPLPAVAQRSYFPPLTAAQRAALPRATVARCASLPPGTQPAFTPDDCLVAEEIVKADERVRRLLRDGYGLTDLDLVACDPWTVHVASLDYAPLYWRQDGVPPRLMQTFMYRRNDADDNQYSHPLHFLPVVDLNAGRVIDIIDADRPAPPSPDLSVNYHRNKLASNTYLQSVWRSAVLAPYNVTQPAGPSFQVHGSRVTWQNWSLRLSFNWREGLVLHDVTYGGRPILSRAALVEMAVPYGDPHPPFQTKCAFDVGDFGLGFCANSLELGCDCLGHIHYFDGVLNDSQGEPYVLRKAICMHEEDAGLLWKHVDYRTGHSESRRSRRLVLSFISTIANYEYLFYWSLMQDGSIEYEIKLSGELSTNMLSEGETEPEYGVIVAPGVNAQLHQHMFCARLDMAVDGPRNSVCEVNVQAGPGSRGLNPYSNAFRAVATPLRTEREAQREPGAARTWKVYNPRSLNPINGKPVAYKLVPHTRGSTQPLLLMGPDSAVTRRGAFGTRALWVTPHRADERFPAGEYPSQSVQGDGLPVWCAADRSIVDQELVLWHSFGVAHVPRVEDFPIMPCEVVGFSLKPDGFFAGNPSIDLRPDHNAASKCSSHPQCCGSGAVSKL